jgi:3-hydroxyacyl-CoA dehydrogenase
VKSLVGLLVVAMICVLGYWFFLRKATDAPEGAATPQQTIDIVGVKNDLIAIAQAERAYQAEHGNYAPLTELISSGALSGAKSDRGGYKYEVESSSTDFRVIAHCPPEPAPTPVPEQTCVSYFVDSSMQVQPLP